MKLFIVLIFCALTPLILANGADNYYSPSTTCRCVNRDLCTYKFSPLIEPRSPKYFCSSSNQVCCKLEHIVPIQNEASVYDDYSTDSAYEDDSYDNDYFYQPVGDNYGSSKKPNHSHQKCGQRTKISAYKRLVLPAAYAALGEFPWQAAILRNYTEGYVFVSSGVLIDRDIILTTAHNVDRLQSNNVLVRLGENNVQADPKRKYHHINARVSKIIVKDDFNRDTLENDFAVLCLEKRVRCNEVVSPICLPEPNDYSDETNYLSNNQCTVSGWGKGSYNGNYSTILRKARLNLVQHDKCQQLIRRRIQDPSYVLDRSFTCAGGELGKDACTGDAGGPLSCLNKNGQQVLTGIVSWGIGCGEKNVPGVYANVRDPASLNWIKNIAIRECRRRDVYNNVPSNNYNNVPAAVNNNYNNVPAAVNNNYNNVPAAVNNDYNNVVPAAVSNYNNVPVVNNDYNNVVPAAVSNYNKVPVVNNDYNNVVPAAVSNYNKVPSLNPNNNYNNANNDYNNVASSVTPNNYNNVPSVSPVNNNHNNGNRPSSVADQYNNRPAINIDAPISSANYNNRPIDNTPYNNIPSAVNADYNRPSSVVDQYNNRPVDQYNNRPVDQYNNRPVDQYNNRPNDQYSRLEKLEHYRETI